MTGGALALALGAAVLHAGWNVLLAGSRDSIAATGALLLFGTLLLAPVALVTGGVSASAAPYIAASAVLELVYFTLLARAYRDGELGVVYPVARGSAPVVVLVLGVCWAGEGGVGARGASGSSSSRRGWSDSCPRAKLGDFLSQAVKKSTSLPTGTSFSALPSGLPSPATRWSTARASSTPSRWPIYSSLPLPARLHTAGRFWSPGAARS